MRSDLRRSQAFAQAVKDRQLAATNQLGERIAVEVESRLLIVDNEQSWGMDPRQRGRSKLRPCIAHDERTSGTIGVRGDNCERRRVSTRAEIAERQVSE